jgi:hypothetical protein
VIRYQSKESENIPNMTETTSDAVIMQYTSASGNLIARPPPDPTRRPVGHPRSSKPPTPTKLLVKYVEADDRDYEDLPELPGAIQIDLAHQAFHAASGNDRIIKDIAQKHGVNFSTLQGRINSAIPKALANQAMQRLSVGKEAALEARILCLAS